MKKIYSFLFAATALFAASSCQKEVAPEVEAPEFEKITFTASTEVDTKTALHENGKSTIWVAGDQISVFDANKEANNRCFNIDVLSEDAKTATFSYEGEFVKDNTQADPTVVALYPYQAKAYCDFFYYDRNYITGLNFPAEQTAVAGGFDPKAGFALGLGTMSTMEIGFQNLYALLKFTVRDAGVKKVTVKVNEGAYIAGDAKIQMVLNTEKIGGSEPVFESPVLSVVENGSNEVTLSCEEGFDTEATYYVAVVPTTISGLSVFFDDYKSTVNTTEKTITLEANKIYNLKDVGSPMKDRYLSFGYTTKSILLYSEEPSYLSGYTEGVVYASSDPTIASVDPNTGLVKALRAGTVTITAKAPKTRYYYEDEASYILEVRKFAPGMGFSSSTAEGVLGQEFEEPELTMHYPAPELLYESSNPTVATVDENGEVTLLAAGETTITATAIETDHSSADKASYTLTVKEQAVLRINNKNGWGDLNITIKQGSTTLVDAKPMVNEGNNIFAYSLDPQYVGKEVTYFIGHSWYTTSTKTTTLKVDSEATAITLNTIYLQPGTWNQNSATFGAWIWGTGVADTMLTGKKVSDDFYEFEIPADGYKNVIFLRCNNNNATADWSRVWNQTEDLTLKHMCFCVNSWTQSDLTDARWF